METLGQVPLPDTLQIPTDLPIRIPLGVSLVAIGIIVGIMRGKKAAKTESAWKAWSSESASTLVGSVLTILGLGTLAGVLFRNE